MGIGEIAISSDKEAPISDSRLLIWISLGGIVTICGTVFFVGMWVKGVEKDREIAKVEYQSLRDTSRDTFTSLAASVEALRSAISELAQIVGNKAITDATQSQRLDAVMDRIVAIERRIEKGDPR